jgi:hypothetical protein
MMRNSGSPTLETVAPSRAVRRLRRPATGALTSRAGDAHQQFPALAFAALAVGLGERQSVLGRGELRRGGAKRDLPLLDRRRRDHLTAELARALEVVVGPGELGLELLDLALRLSDRSVGARGRSVVLSEFSVELAAVEPRQNLSGRHRVAVLGVEFFDRQAVDPRRRQRLFARHQRSRNKQPIDEFTLHGGRHRHCRRLDEARRLGRRGGRRAVRARGKSERGERRGRRRAGREKPERGDRDEARNGCDGEDNERAAHQRDAPGSGKGAIAPANSAFNTPRVIAASASPSKSGSSARRLDNPPTRVNITRAAN